MVFGQSNEILRSPDRTEPVCPPTPLATDLFLSNKFVRKMSRKRGEDLGKKKTKDQTRSFRSSSGRLLPPPFPPKVEILLRHPLRVGKL